MYVSKRGDKWRFGERYKDPLTDKWKATTVTFDRNTRNTRHEAQIYLDKKVRKILTKATGKQLESPDITLQELYDEFWKERHSGWRPTTKKVYKMSLERFIDYFGPDCKAKKITPAMLSNYFDELVTLVNSRKAGESVDPSLPKFRTASGLRMYRRHISMLFNFAVHKRCLESNPMRDVKTQWPKDDTTSTAKKYLENNERQAVIGWIRSIHPLIADMLEWQYYTGMRFGEVAALQVSDVDLKAKSVSVKGTLDYTSSTRAAGYKKQYMTKTNAGMRSIVLSDQAIDIYKRHRKGKKASSFLFVNYEGHMISPGTVDGMLRRCKKEIGLDKTLTTHTFRHTHISKLAELGVPLYVIQHNVGHSDDKITRDIYLHVTKNAQQLLRDKLSSM